MVDLTKTAILSLIDSTTDCRNLNAEELKVITSLDTAFKYGFAMGVTECDLYRYKKKLKPKRKKER